MQNSKNFKILIYDTNASKCDYLPYLQSQGWKAYTVSDGQMALDSIRESFENCDQAQQFDLVIADAILLKIDDFQLLHDLKKHALFNIPIIIISTPGSDVDFLEGLQAGADDYLIKPFSAIELVTRVKTQLQLNKQRRALLAELNTMTRLQAIATRFVQEGNMLTILLETIDAAISITKADRGTIQFVDEHTATLKWMASRGFDQSFLNHVATGLIDKDGYGKILNSNDRIIIKDITQNSTLIKSSILQTFLKEGIRAVQFTPLKTHAGKTLGILATYYHAVFIPQSRDLQMLDLLARLLADIIDRVQWTLERVKYIDKLYEIDRRKNNFLAVLSHELRNPLASISNSSFVLSQAAADSQAAQRAQVTIARQLKKMVRLIDDLLDVTRITQNKIQLRRERVDINELVCRTIEDNQLTYETMGITVKITLADSPVMIYADPIRITQVISNLVQNAAKFSLPGQTVSVQVASNEEEAILQVIDTGIGIEAELLDNLFEPFMQADRSLDRSKGGLGLGLSLVKGLVDLHNGSVSAISDGINKGAKFTVTLPLDHSVNSSKKKIESTVTTTIPNRCVLIIEDNIAAADSLSMVLEMFGHNVHISHNGVDGIQAAKKLKPDCILCDIGLPGPDGYQVAKILKADKDCQSIYLIALSGYAQPEDIQKSLNAGFDFHLAKPPDLDMLKQLLLEIDNRPLAYLP